MAATHPETCWVVRIDRWHPTRLNQLINSHWAVANRLKKHDAAFIRLAVLGADVPAAEGKRRVSLTITLAPRQRAGDPDAYWKSVLDALVKCGALVNDSHVWCEVGSVTFERGEEARTVIRLEDMPGEKRAKDQRPELQRLAKRRFRVVRS